MPEDVLHSTARKARGFENLSPPANTGQIWRFGVFGVGDRREELCRSGTPVKVREQSFRILVYLLEHPGEIVTRAKNCTRCPGPPIHLSTSTTAIPPKSLARNSTESRPAVRPDAFHQPRAIKKPANPPTTSLTSTGAILAKCGSNP